MRSVHMFVPRIMDMWAVDINMSLQSANKRECFTAVSGELVANKTIWDLYRSPIRGMKLHFVKAVSIRQHNVYIAQIIADTVGKGTCSGFSCNDVGYTYISLLTLRSNRSFYGITCYLDISSPHCWNVQTIYTMWLKIHAGMQNQR